MKTCRFVMNLNDVEEKNAEMNVNAVPGEVSKGPAMMKSTSVVAENVNEDLRALVARDHLPAKVEEGPARGARVW